MMLKLRLRRLRPNELRSIFHWAMEFVIVVIGVLLALVLAEWVEARRTNQLADQAFDAAVAQAREVLAAQKWWAVHGDCIIGRAEKVARAAAAGETLTRKEIGRPALPIVEMPDWNEDIRQAASVRQGPERMVALQAIEFDATAMFLNLGEIRAQWATFGLLDPANGMPSDADRATVRSAAIRAADLLRLLRYQSAGTADASRALGLGDVAELNNDDIADECGLLKNW